MEDLVPFSGLVKGTQAMWLVTKDDTGAASVQGVYAGAGSASYTGTFYPSFGGYRYLVDPQRKSIYTGLDWTQTEIDDLTLGMKRIS
jgi:hypothetical protein